MPSPFPGMNPYLEQAAAWPDFHQAYLTELRRQLTPEARGRYIVKLEEQVYLHDPFAEDRELLGRPDISLTSLPSSTIAAAETATAVAVAAAPAEAMVSNFDELRLGYIEIRDREEMRLITVIELLSPSNKRPGGDRLHYESKRKRLLAGPVHLIELDLLRQHPPMPFHRLPDSDYRVIVSRATARPRVAVWPLKLRDPLPTIPVPVKPEDADLTLDLMAAMHRTYDDAGYADYIYRHDPEPLLHPDDAKWAATLIEAEREQADAAA